MRTNTGQAILLKNYKQPEYLIETVDLDINLHPSQTRVKAAIRFVRNKGTNAGTPLKLDGDELTLIGAHLNGTELGPKQYKATPLQFVLKNPPKSKKFTLELETEIDPTANTKLMGLYRSSGNYCTQCEAEGFRRITYFLDRPDVLAVYTTRLEAEKSDAPILLGNGNPVKKGSAGKGRHFTIWHDPHPKPSYLFALVGGELGSIHKNFKTMSGRKVKLGIYVGKGKEEAADYAMDALIRSMKWDEEVFGCEYDLDVFNIVAVSDFNMGAMENKGLNIFNDKYVLGDPDTATDDDYANIERIIAHEYFHNWTGNRITCRDWFQLCLKEGLTVYRDQEFSSDERSRSVERIHNVRGLRSAQFPEDAGPLAHPVRPDKYHEINNFYTATVYQKGAELVRMIAALLGETKFRKGMDLYLKRHDGDAATIEDFIACFEKASKTDLSQFMHWYEQAGTPSLNVGSKYDKAKAELTLEVEQFIPATPGQKRKSPTLIPQRIGLIGSGGRDMTGLKLAGAEISDDTIVLDKRKHKLVFSNVTERPVVSMNRDFTAPVEINYRQSDADLAFLAAHDSDEFGRWQAYQTYAIRLMLSATKAVQAGKRVETDERFLEISKQILTDASLEPAFRAAVLTLPGMGEIAQIMARNVDPDAISRALNSIGVALGKSLEDVRPSLLKSLKNDGPFSPDADAAGKRSLTAVVMRHAIISKSEPALKEILRHYKKADNMTDRFNALRTIVHYHPQKAVREEALAAFYKRYKNNHIVLDKWFSVQASRPGSATVSTVKSLMRHEDFTFNNPNRFRALIGVFAMGNISGFNAANGRGYELVAKSIAKLDTINPQVAARMLTAFRSYRSLEAARRKLAEKSLKELAKTPNLSRDVSDILERTLAT